MSDGPPLSHAVGPCSLVSASLVAPRVPLANSPLFQRMVDPTRGSAATVIAWIPPQDWPMADTLVVSILPWYLLPARLFSATAQSMLCLSWSALMAAVP